MTSKRPSIVILGAGPAGVGAAARLARRDAFDIVVVEQRDVVGGNAGSFDLDGMRVDYGSHRLHPACNPEILSDITEMLGEDLLDRPRHGRIRLRGRWLHFPLRPLDLALRLPPSFALGVLRDSVMGSSRKDATATFASTLEQGLGRTICGEFYFPYAEKIWGIPPTQLDSEQARRRVSANSMGGMVKKLLKAVPGLAAKGSGRFFYPRNGYGQISEAYFDEATRRGVRFRFGSRATTVRTVSGRVASVRVGGRAEDTELVANQVLSTIPLPALTRAVCPKAPADVLEATEGLRYRAMVLVYLVLDTEQFSEFDAHYFPEHDVAFTRISEPKNYGLAANPNSTVLCAELPCDPADSVWSMSDTDLGDLVASSLATVGLPVQVSIRRIETRRLRQAYPIYTRGYQERFAKLDSWIDGIDGLVSFGRQGLFAHDNTHHALAMSYAIDECVDSNACLNRKRWAGYRRTFESHVVED